MTKVELEREVEKLRTANAELIAKYERLSKEANEIVNKYRVALEEVEFNRNVLKAIGKLAK